MGSCYPVGSVDGVAIPSMIHNIPRPYRFLEHRRFGWLALGAALLAGTLPCPARGDDPPWPYTPVKRPVIPAVQQKGWLRSPVDAFILARLEQAGLQPSQPAERLILLERVTFDMTGLAPTLAARDDF